MSKKIQAVAIPATGPGGDPHGGNGAAGAAVQIGGGLLEVSTLDANTSAALYFDEEGKRKGLGRNNLATLLVRHFHLTFGDRIDGDALLVGSTFEDDEADVPTGVAELVWSVRRKMTDRG